jgi:hypothetical protein
MPLIEGGVLHLINVVLQLFQRRVIALLEKKSDFNGIERYESISAHLLLLSGLQTLQALLQHAVGRGTIAKAQK